MYGVMFSKNFQEQANFRYHQVSSDCMHDLSIFALCQNLITFISPHLFIYFYCCCCPVLLLSKDIAIYNWRASVVSETLTGVTQLKIGDVCLFIYICLDVHKAVLYFDPRVFVLVRWSTPSQTSLNRILCLSISTRITLEIELFTVLNSFTGTATT